MEKMIVSSSPHLQERVTTQKIMLDVIIALIPAIIAATVIFGLKSLLLVAVCVISCILSEYIARKVMKRSNTVSDLSCVVTGILLALNMPVAINPLIAVFGSVIAIVVVKQMFGGIGQNFVNPAMTARVILMNSFPTKMTEWTAPFDYLSKVDATTTATPLVLMGSGSEVLPGLQELLLGNYGGCIGETCSLALILGGIYLILRKVISPVIPVTYIATVAAISLIAGRNVAVDLLAGGLLLGAIFMATDYATSPLTFWGRVIYAVGCGLLTMLIRIFGSLTEGVSYAIILMNILTPLIEKFTKPIPFGRERGKREG